MKTENKEVIEIEMSDLIEAVEAAVSEKNGCIRITIVGMSMYPLLRSGSDSAVLYPIDKIKKNDVLFYVRDSGRCVIHRCLGIKDGEYIMCGDNQTEKEYGIRREQIKAVARVFFRGDRKITQGTLWYRIYVFLWCTLFPLRPMLTAVLKRIMRLKK